MATIIVDAPLIGKPTRRTGEHLFFWGMSVWIALIVFIGFARTYFLVGYFNGPPIAAVTLHPAPIVHVHAAVFTSWIVLLVTQASLAASGNINIHRRLGLAGLFLAPLMVVLGVAVAVEMLNRLATAPHIDSKIIFAAALGQIVGFAGPVFFAFSLRRKPAFHKRLILIGTIAILGAAYGRWPVHFLLHKPLASALAMFATLLVMIAYDLKSLGKVHRATAFGVVWVICIQSTAVAIGPTAAWHRLASRVQQLGT
jgi:hypothetical protein